MFFKKGNLTKNKKILIALITIHVLVLLFLILSKTSVLTKIAKIGLSDEKLKLEYMVELKDGVHTFYPLDTTNIADSIPHGLALSYRDSVLVYSSEYIQGVRHGYTTFYNEYGEKSAVFKYFNGHLQDTSYFFDINQRITSKKVFDENNLTTSIHLNDYKQPFLTFYHDSIHNIPTNIPGTYSLNSKTTLVLTDSTYKVLKGDEMVSGDLNFKSPYYLVFDTIPSMITFSDSSKIKIYKPFIPNYKIHELLPEEMLLIH